MHNKVAIVTGAASGIGKATAMCIAREGGSVVIVDIDKDGAEAVAKDVIDRGGRAMGLEVDVADTDRLRDMVEETVARFGRLDVLVNNAADLSQNAIDGDVLSTDLEVVDRAYTANLRSAYAACKFSIPHMLESGGGSIVNVSSIQSLLGDAQRVAYSMSKSGMNSLSRSIATRFGKKGIRCNTVCPGPVMNRDEGRLWPEEMQAAYRSHVLTPDVGRPSELGEVITFLVSDKASFITGQTISVDGGFTAQMHLQFDLMETKLNRQ